MIISRDQNKIVIPQDPELDSMQNLDRFPGAAPGLI